MFSKIANLDYFPLTTLLLKNNSKFGEGGTKVLTNLDLGSSAGFAVGPSLEVAFGLGIGQEAGVCLDEGGLVSVEACSLPGTGEACVGVVVSGLLMGEPSGEDSISSTTEGPSFVVLLLLVNP